MQFLHHLVAVLRDRAVLQVQLLSMLAMLGWFPLQLTVHQVTPSLFFIASAYPSISQPSHVCHLPLAWQLAPAVQIPVRYHFCNPLLYVPLHRLLVHMLSIVQVTRSFMCFVCTLVYICAVLAISYSGSIPRAFSRTFSFNLFHEHNPHPLVQTFITNKRCA